MTFPVDTPVRTLGKDWKLCLFTHSLSKPELLTPAALQR